MNIAFLGTGLLGYPMAEKLLEAGHQLFVYNRTKSKASGLKELGASVCSKPKEAILKADVAVLVLSDANAIEEVLFQDEKALTGKTIIQMGTIASAQSSYFLKRVNNLGGVYFECPVLGSRGEASAGKLILMFGGEEELFNQYKDLLSCFGPDPKYVGPVGKAAILKLALNQLIASHVAGFSLSLGLIENSGIDVDLFSSIVCNSALNAPMYSKKLPNWIDRNYENPNFPIKHLIKDVDLILSEAADKNLNTKALTAILDLLKSSEQDGLGDMDYSAIYDTINKR